MGDKENPVCEKTITIQEKSQDGAWQHDAIIVEPPTPVIQTGSGKTQSLLQQVAAKYNVARRAVHIAAVAMNAAGLCRYDTVDKCRHHYPDDATCEKCIENWLLVKARKELRHG